MLLNLEQIAELLESVKQFHTIFIAKQVGTSVLTSDDKKVLLKYGIDIAKLPKLGIVADSFRWGILSEALGHKRASTMNYADLKRFIKSGNFLPLTTYEQEALNIVQTQSYNDIKGLGNKISTDFTRLIIEGDKTKRRKYEKVIRDAAAEAIETRQDVRQFASALGHKTQDWCRDFDRIADYILHDAYDRGRCISIQRKDGDDAEVYKSVYVGACEHCQRLYLTNGIGSRPIVFKLGDLIANGSNIGRKTKEWKPVIGSTHNWCRCQLEHKRKNMEWDAETQGFTKVIRDNKGVQRKSKAKITLIIE